MGGGLAVHRERGKKSPSHTHMMHRPPPPPPHCAATHLEVGLHLHHGGVRDGLVRLVVEGLRLPQRAQLRRCDTILGAQVHGLLDEVLVVARDVQVKVRERLPDRRGACDGRHACSAGEGRTGGGDREGFDQRRANYLISKNNPFKNRSSFKRGNRRPYTQRLFSSRAPHNCNRPRSRHTSGPPPPTPPRTPLPPFLASVPSLSQQWRHSWRNISRGRL